MTPDQITLVLQILNIQVQIMLFLLGGDTPKLKAAADALAQHNDSLQAALAAAPK